MRINKKLAGVAAAALAASGIAVIAAPSALAYGPAAESLNCRIYFGDTGTGTSPSTYNDTFSLTASPATAAPGQTVTLTFSATTGTINGPVPLNAGVISPVATIALSGAQSGTVVLSDGPTNTYPAAATPAATALGPYSLTGTFVAGATTGSVSAALQQFRFDDGRDGGGTGSNVDTYCSDANADLDHKAAPVTSSVIVQPVAISNTSVTITAVSGQTVNNYARAGNTISYTLADFVNGTANVALCANPGDAIATCTDAGTATVSGGSATGTLPVTAATSAGVKYLKAVSGASSATAQINILGAPSISLAPASGGAGTVIAVTGSNFNPNGGASLFACPTAPCIPAGPTANTVASGTGSVNATGAFTGSITSATGGTTIQAGQGAGPTALTALASFSFNALECTVPAPANGTTSCNTQQNIAATVTGGVLKQVAEGASVNLGSIATGLAAGTLTGSINAVDVTDTRGGQLGWTLTGSLTDFTTPGGATITKNNLSIAPTCVETNANSATGESAGPGGTFASTQTLCTKDTTANSPGGTSGGEYEVDGALTLNVPAFQAAGAYSATLTVTLA